MIKDSNENFTLTIKPGPTGLKGKTFSSTFTGTIGPTGNKQDESVIMPNDSFQN